MTQLVHYDCVSVHVLQGELHGKHSVYVSIYLPSVGHEETQTLSRNFNGLSQDMQKVSSF